MDTKIVEPLLHDHNRHSVIPLDPTFSSLWNCYKAQERVFWTAQQIKFDRDKKQFPLLPQNVKDTIISVLVFFGKADGIVEENLSTNFLQEINLPEASVMLTFQAMMENIHAEVYNNNILELFPLESDRSRIFGLVESSPIIERKIAFAHKYMNISNDNGEKIPLSHRIVAFCAVEGINFSGSFAFIDWLKEKKYDLEGMYLHNNYISRDENMHTIGGVLMEKIIIDKASDSEVKEILDEAMDIEIEFFKTILPSEGFEGDTVMNINNMITHIKYCGAYLANMLGRNIYNKNLMTPFKFMTKRNTYIKSNFFEKEEFNYTMGNDTTINPNSFKINYDDF
jgi:ribonucleotide reductase beta subunit family protein with ferritin-like domain